MFNGPRVLIMSVMFVFHVHLSGHCTCIFIYEQTLSPQAKGLFHRAIFQSGVATLGTYTTSHPLGYAKVL